MYVSVRMLIIEGAINHASLFGARALQSSTACPNVEEAALSVKKLLRLRLQARAALAWDWTCVGKLLPESVVYRRQCVAEVDFQEDAHDKPRLVKVLCVDVITAAFFHEQEFVEITLCVSARKLCAEVFQDTVFPLPPTGPSVSAVKEPRQDTEHVVRVFFGG